MSTGHACRPAQPATITLVIKDIPCRATLHEVVGAIGSRFIGRFDYFYMPVKPRSGQNRGYAFAGFVDHVDAEEFSKKLSGMVVPGRESSKVLSVELASNRTGQPLQKAWSQHVMREFTPWGPLFVIQKDLGHVDIGTADSGTADSDGPVWLGVRPMTSCHVDDKLAPMKIPVPTAMTISV